MTNALGYAASCAVLASFLMRTMLPLRLVAILSNILFVAFGYVQHIHPILLLHAVLLPINSWQLLILYRTGPSRLPLSLGFIANRAAPRGPKVAESGP